MFKISSSEDEFHQKIQLPQIKLFSEKDDDWEPSQT